VRASAPGSLARKVTRSLPGSIAGARCEGVSGNHVSQFGRRAQDDSGAEAELAFDGLLDAAAQRDEIPNHHCGKPRAALHIGCGSRNLRDAQSSRKASILILLWPPTLTPRSREMTTGMASIRI